MNRLLFALLLLAAACASSCDRRARQACRMTDEYVVATLPRPPDALSLVPTGPRRLLLTYSTVDGTFMRRIDANGAAVSDIRRIEEKRNGAGQPDKSFWPEGHRIGAVHIATAVSDKGTIAQCLILPDGPDGHVAAIAFVDASTLDTVRIVSLGAVLNRSLACAFHHRSLFVARETPSGIDIVRLSTTFEIRATRHLADGHPRHPALLTAGDRIHFVWSRTAGTRRDLVTAILDDQLTFRRGVRIDRHEMDDPAPFLSTVDTHPALVFRDDRDDDGLAEFYFTRFDSDGAPAFAPVRISRADGPDGPSLSAGRRFLYSAAVRSYRGNYLVGFNHFDRRGTKQGGEFQVYADKCDFTRTALHADDDHVLLVYAEDNGETGRILSATVNCQPD